MKKILSVFFAVMLLCGVFAGCTPRGGDVIDEDGNLILRVWAPDEYAGTEVKAKFDSWIEKLNNTEEMKALKVKLEFTGGQVQMPISLGTACLTGKAPELVIWDRFATPSNTNLLYPLEDFITRDKIDTTKFLPEAYQECSVEKDGVLHQYGLPMDADPWGIYLNMDIITDYNTKNPSDKIEPENLDTWTKLMEAADKLTVREGSTVKRSGLNTTSADGQFFPFVYTGTGELINTERTSGSYGDTVLKANAEVQKDPQSKRVYDTLAFFEELYSRNVCNTGHGGTDAFGNGLCAMTYGSIYFPQQLSAYKLKNYKMIPFPARDRSYKSSMSAVQVDPAGNDDGMKNGQVGGMLGGYSLSIPMPAQQFRNDKWKARVEKAWEVIKLWTLDDAINEMYFTTNEAITCRSDLLTNQFYNKDGVMKDIIPFLNNYKTRPSVPGYEQFESNIVRAQIQSMKEGKLTALTTFGKIRDDGNTTLRQAQGRA